MFFTIMQIFCRKLLIFWFSICTHHYCNCKFYIVLILPSLYLYWHPCLIFFFAISCVHNIVVNVTEKVTNEKTELTILLQHHAHKCQYNIVSKYRKVNPQLSFYHFSKASELFRGKKNELCPRLQSVLKLLGASPGLWCPVALFPPSRWCSSLSFSSEEQSQKPDIHLHLQQPLPGPCRLDGRCCWTS